MNRNKTLKKFESVLPPYVDGEIVIPVPVCNFCIQLTYTLKCP